MPPGPVGRSAGQVPSALGAAGQGAFTGPASRRRRPCGRSGARSTAVKVASAEVLAGLGARISDRRFGQKWSNSPTPVWSGPLGADNQARANFDRRAGLSKEGSLWPSTARTASSSSAQVAQEFLAGETLDRLARRHDVCRTGGSQAARSRLLGTQNRGKFGLS